MPKGAKLNCFRRLPSIKLCLSHNNFILRKKNLVFFGLFSECPTEKYPLQRKLDMTEGIFFLKKVYNSLKKNAKLTIYSIKAFPLTFFIFCG